MKCQPHFFRALIGAFAAMITLTIAAGSVQAQATVDIGPMTWTPRSDWINVKNCSAITGGPNAVGNGTADDTAAIQAVFNYLEYNQNTVSHPELTNVTTPKYLTVYFPAGTYLISNTLRLNSLQNTGMVGVSLIGCGSNTTIKWADNAPLGLAMFAPNGTDYMRYLGFVWDGNNRAGCGIEHNTTPNITDGSSTYESPIRHDNESFRNFTTPGTYIAGETLPSAGIAQGFRTDLNPPHTYNPTSEVSVFNCRFSNCTVGIGTTMTGAGNNYMWKVDGCEFDQCAYGIYFPNAGGYMVTNDHFQQSSVTDLYGGLPHIRHCTSSGSAMFYEENTVPYSSSPDIIQDCWVDRWTTPGPAIKFGALGPNTVFDCIFTNPPAGAGGAIHNDSNTPPPSPGSLRSSLILSNNYAPAFPTGLGIVDSSTSFYYDVIPPGQRGGLVSSPTQTFLKTSWPDDSKHIIDVTLPPYTANNNGGGDSTATIQAAINAAQAANNGSVVYFPAGTYHIYSPLTATGGNYTLQGCGIRSSLRWMGSTNSPVLNISDPHNLTVQGLNISDLTSCLLETAVGPSNISFDDFNCFYVQYGDNAYRGGEVGQGLVLSNLPAHSTVSLGRVNAPLTVVNCGPAQILAKFLEFSTLSVSGTLPKTGFLGIEIGEGGQSNAGAYNITVNDNQDLVMSDWYTEGKFNDLDLERGSGTGTGHVTIEGVNSASVAPQSQTTVLANNYAGRLFYGSTQFVNYNNSHTSPDQWPVNITQTGTNALDMLFPGDTFSLSAPTFMLDSGANVVQADGLINNHQSFSSTPDSPNPLTASDLTSLAGGLDDLRQLETAEAAQQTGLVGYWKLDEAAGPTSRDATISGQDGTWMNGPTFAAGRRQLDWPIPAACPSTASTST